MSEYVFIRDTQTGVVLFANEAMENLFGYDVTGTDSRAFVSGNAVGGGLDAAVSGAVQQCLGRGNIIV